jgi:hypothetical protein
MPDEPIPEQVAAAVSDTCGIQGYTLGLLMRRGLIDRSEAEEILVDTQKAMTETRIGPSAASAVIHIIRSAVDAPGPPEKPE